MEIIKTNFKDLLIIQPTVYKDDRGHFYESFKKNMLDEVLGFSRDFVQENESFSHNKVFRGFHFQKPPFAQAKLVKVAVGTVVDIVIDLRRDSETFKQTYQIELSGLNKKMLYVPRGFAHGFLVTSPNGAIFQYKCDNFYNKDSESGVTPLDSSLNIQWPYHIDDMIIHTRDKNHLKINQF